jgi:UDP-glucose 4-epimerase
MNLSQRRVLIPGGAGFIGSHVTELFAENQAEVLVADDLSFGKKELVDDRADFVKVDVTTEQFSEVVQRFDPNIIVNLAAIHFIPYCNEHPEEAFNVNVMGCRNVIQSSLELTDLEMLLFASSAAVYPPRKGPNSEQSTANPTDIYGRSKLIGEDLCRLFHQDTGVTTAALRLFNVYGPNETNDHLIPAILEQLDGETPTVELGNLTPARDFVHVRDVARACHRVATTLDEGFERYNVGTGVEHSVKEVAETIIDASDYEATVEQASDRVRESDRPHLQADVSKIKSEIGWEPTISFEDGIADLVNR